MSKWIASTIVSIGLAAVTSLVLADPSNSPTPGEHSKHHGAWSHHKKSAFSLPSERIEARLAYIKTALKITDAQKPQWETFADMERKQAKAEDKMVQDWQAKREQYHEGKNEQGLAEEQEHSHLTAIEHLEHKKEFLSNALTRLDAKLAAIRPLYSVLSEEQKRIADEVLADCHHHGRDHGKFEHISFHESLLIGLHRLVQI